MRLARRWVGLTVKAEDVDLFGCEIRLSEEIADGFGVGVAEVAFEAFPGQPTGWAN